MQSSDTRALLPSTPIKRLSRPIVNFLRIEASGGLLLLVGTLVALAAANSEWSESYLGFWTTPVALSVGSATLSHSLGEWINDGLMTLFFFVVGLEIKREIVSGELKDIRSASAPAIAALGGMIAPAMLYLLVIGKQPGAHGWGVPMATDIAFVVGFLSLLGSRVPHGLKVFMLSLAIIDDIGAVIVIAFFYSTNVSLGALALGAVGYTIIVIQKRLGVRHVLAYFLVGVGIWLAFLFSGVHPTVAGVLLGLMTPANPWIGKETFGEVMSRFWNPKEETPTQTQMQSIAVAAKEAVSPLERLEQILHPWVAFVIMPIFALANAGVPFEVDALGAPVTAAVAVGLLLGKPLGIVTFTWIAVRFLGSRLPIGVNWKILSGAGFLGGIGFTMSIFIASLGLDGHLLVSGKVGTLLGSAAATLIGLLILCIVLPRSPTAENES